jgi:hypothetical protein
MTDLEKKIYNKHLAISKSLRNKPFKLRNNFEDFENDSKYIFIKRLANLFTRHPDIDIDMYFSAPYQLYKDVNYFDLNFFASPRAIKTYTIYKQELLYTSPDNQIDSVKKSLHFIVHFCLQNKINFEDYPYFKESGLQPIWIYHIKRNKINPYSIMEFPNIVNFINELQRDERSLLLGQFGDNFFAYKNNYLTSKKLRSFLTEAFIKLKFFVDKNLNSTKYTI